MPCAMSGGLALGSILLCVSCMHTPRSSDRTLATAPPPADSATVILWRMDESGGDHVLDDGPFHIDAIAGNDTRAGFGRLNSARHFSRSIQSFIYAPYAPALDLPTALTIEAWVLPEVFGSYEDTPLVTRWTERANEQSWIFGITGVNIGASTLDVQNPGYHRALVQRALIGHLMFAIQPENAGRPLSYFSVAQIELNRWTHVAVTYDGELVRFYINGRLDSQHALKNRIRQTQAPLLAGNYFDPHWLTEFGGVLNVSAAFDQTPYYAFVGMIDDLRISNVARSEFPGTGRK